MAKKVNLDFVPSEYQEKFFDWVEHGVGNAVIKASAGSGKTSTAIASMKFIPKNQKCLFIAFNKSIAEELNRRLDGLTNCVARTIHSLGYLMLKRNLGKKIELDEYKYRNYVKSNISELTTTDGQIKTQKQIDDYIESITSLINYSRFNLAQSEKEINDIAQKYSIPLSFDECVVTQKCLEWGKSNINTVDYTDMIWLPVELLLKPKGLTFDWVYIDEAQDCSMCSTQLFLKCLKRGGRFVSIGDEAQSINMFAGSSEEAFEYMKSSRNTTTFSLPISYRCPKKVIRLANTIVKDIYPKENAIEGEIANNCHVRDIKDGDMVLCRSKAPLINLYVKLLRKGVNCYIKGQDIGLKLINVLEKVNMEILNSDLSEDGVFIRLYDKMFAERNKLMQTRGLDYNDATLSSFVMEKYDMLSTLSILAEKCKTKNELINRINEIFKDESNGVCLSTIHKAKGLESDNVYILCHSSMPSKLATHDWEKMQEKNLMYVAYTRAKKKLGFISEKEIKPFGVSQEPGEILETLSLLERKVCKVLNKEPTEKIESIDIIKLKLKTAKEISPQKLHEIDNKFEIESQSNRTNKDILSDLESLTD